MVGENTTNEYYTTAPYFIKYVPFLCIILIIIIIFWYFIRKENILIFKKFDLIIVISFILFIIGTILFPIVWKKDYEYVYDDGRSASGVRWIYIGQYGCWLILISLIIYIITIILLTNKIFQFKKNIKTLLAGWITFIIMFFIALPIIMSIIYYNSIDYIYYVLYSPEGFFYSIFISLCLIIFGIIGISIYYSQRVKGKE